MGMTDFLVADDRSGVRRLLKLDSLLAERRLSSVEEVARSFRISTKTIRRDLRRLERSLGVRIRWDPSRRLFLKDNPGRTIIGLIVRYVITLQIAAEAMHSLQTVSVAKTLRALAEDLTQLLPQSSRTEIEAMSIGSRLLFTSRPADAIQDRIWNMALEALLAQRRLAIRYKAITAAGQKALVVDPMHLACLQGEWYLFCVGYKLADDSDWIEEHGIGVPSDLDPQGEGLVLQLSLKRIQSLRPLEDKTAPESRRRLDIRQLLQYTLGRFAAGVNPQQVVVRIDKALAERARERIWHPCQQIRDLPDGGVEIYFEISEKALAIEGLLWVMQWGRHATVIKPDSLRRLVADEIRAMAERYET